MTPEILFAPPPRNLELANGDVHVFCAALDQPLSRRERLAKILSEDERARAAGFVFERDRNRFIAGRGMLREILGWLLHADPAQLAFAYGDHGKPRLARPAGGRFLHFNLAHSDALAVYAVSALHAVGIDIEHLRPIRETDEIATRFFSAQEVAELASLPAGLRAEFFFNCWTRKEALLKTAGIGLTESSNSPLSDQARLRHQTADGASHFHKYYLHPLAPACGYTGALAADVASPPYCWSLASSSPLTYS